MKRIKHPSGAYEFVPDEKEQASKDKYKGKKAKDLTDAQIKELVYELAKRAGLV